MLSVLCAKLGKVTEREVRGRSENSAPYVSKSKQRCAQSLCPAATLPTSFLIGFCILLSLWCPRKEAPGSGHNILANFHVIQVILWSGYKSHFFDTPGCLRRRFGNVEKRIKWRESSKYSTWFYSSLSMWVAFVMKAGGWEAQVYKPHN